MSDVGSPYPGAGEGPKGPAVRRLKGYASWVQNVVRQFGLYPVHALILERSLPQYERTWKKESLVFLLSATAMQGS